jgi:hypothetical protein
MRKSDVPDGARGFDVEWLATNVALYGDAGRVLVREGHAIDSFVVLTAVVGAGGRLAAGHAAGGRGWGKSRLGFAAAAGHGDGGGRGGILAVRRDVLQTKLAPMKFAANFLSGIGYLFGRSRGATTSRLGYGRPEQMRWRRLMSWERI